MGRHEADNRPMPYPAVVVKKAKFNWENLPKYAANAKKAIIQVIGLLTSLLALGVLPNPYSVWVTVILAILTTVTHYQVANAPTPTEEVPQGDDAAVPPI